MKTEPNIMYITLANIVRQHNASQNLIHTSKVQTQGTSKLIKQSIALMNKAKQAQ